MDMAAEDVKQTYYKLMAEVSTSKEDYQAYVETRPNDLNQHIDKLEAQMAEVSSEAKSKNAGDYEITQTAATSR